MRELNIGSLGGLHYELYDLSPARRAVTSLIQYSKEAPAFLDLNGFFWSQLLCVENIGRMLEELRVATTLRRDVPNSFRAAVQDPERFVARVLEAESGQFEQDQTERSFFGHMETLAVLCKIYSFLYGKGFELTVHEGYQLDSYSSVQLIGDCLQESKNPYLPFLRKHAWPALMEFQPECVWINGRLTLANMAVACFLRRQFSDVKVFWAGEGSEYYATNKITNYLAYNTPLFQVLDGIVLFDYAETRRQISGCLNRGDDLGGVANLLYAERASDGETRIRQTEYYRYHSENHPVVVRREAKERGPWRISPSELVNIHLFPNNTCFWRKCAFCGINGKYPQPLCATSPEDLWPVENALERLYRLECEGVRYFWSIDEAIPAETLCALANGLSQHDSRLRWQARSRISPRLLTQGVPEMLARGGLRELRLGLESASLRVLTRMNKFGADFSLTLVEQIVAAFGVAGIHIHFPMIIGFPTETALEREQTYRFLAYLRERYDNFSFNINIFAMDVSSPIFADWDSYDVSMVSFPCSPRYFLGNLVNWDCAEVPFQEAELKQERDRVMRELLYPWMPEDALISPHILYRLLETTRSTLFRNLPGAATDIEDAPRHSNAMLRLRAFALLPESAGLGTPAMNRYYSFGMQTCLETEGDFSAFFDFAAVPHSYGELLAELMTMPRITWERADIFLRRCIQSGLFEYIE